MSEKGLFQHNRKVDVRGLGSKVCRGPPPQSALALSLRCGRSRSTRSPRLAGYLRGQVINSGEEQLENRRGVCLVVTEDQINRWRFTLQRTAGYGPGQKITRVGGQQRYGAGRRDHGHRMGNVVHLVIRSDIQAGPLQVVLDHNARGRGRLRWYDECFAHDLSQFDGIAHGKAVVAGEYDDERLRNHTPVNQLVRRLFRPHERGVEPAPLKASARSGEFWLE